MTVLECGLLAGLWPAGGRWGPEWIVLVPLVMALRRAFRASGRNGWERPLYDTGNACGWAGYLLLVLRMRGRRAKSGLPMFGLGWLPCGREGPWLHGPGKKIGVIMPSSAATFLTLADTASSKSACCHSSCGKVPGATQSNRRTCDGHTPFVLGAGPRPVWPAPPGHWPTETRLAADKPICSPHHPDLTGPAFVL